MKIAQDTTKNDCYATYTVTYTVTYEQDANDDKATAFRKYLKFLKDKNAVRMLCGELGIKFDELNSMWLYMEDEMQEISFLLQIRDHVTLV